MASTSDESGAAPFANGTVSKRDLKRLTGEFDLESIYQLSLAARGLRSLGCLPDCAGLEFLSLADNQLTDVSMLAGLKRLRYLSLAGNRLACVAGLDGCEALVHLDLSGNLIACTEDLQPLSELASLESLQLQDRPSGLSNPLCMSAGYARKILDSLPGLVCLDGDRVRGSGEAYYQLCQQVEMALSGDDSAAVSDRQQAAAAVSGLGEAFWTLGGTAAGGSGAIDEAEAGFAGAVARVRDQELRAMLLMEECERDLLARKRKT